MKSEIDKNFYCSANAFTENNIEEECWLMGSCEGYDCLHKHRKHPKPEQYKEEYGEEYFDDAAVYIFFKDVDGISKWIPSSYHDALIINEEQVKRGDVKYPVVCACTPFGKPGKDWRPE